jgi:hypothetical protein
MSWNGLNSTTQAKNESHGSFDSVVDLVMERSLTLLCVARWKGRGSVPGSGTRVAQANGWRGLSGTQKVRAETGSQAERRMRTVKEWEFGSPDDDEKKSNVKSMTKPIRVDLRSLGGPTGLRLRWPMFKE